jgi:hypothetical protein
MEGTIRASGQALPRFLELQKILICLQSFELLCLGGGIGPP